jgi:hypothetical protein
MVERGQGKSDIPTIAKGLSETQRRVIRRARDGFVLIGPRWSRWRLFRKGLIRPWLFKGSWTLTDTGFVVADYLRSLANDA